MTIGIYPTSPFRLERETSSRPEGAAAPTFPMRAVVGTAARLDPAGGNAATGTATGAD